MRLVVLFSLILSSFAVQAQTPFEICYDAARYHYDLGNDIRPRQWCSDVSTRWMANCRATGLERVRRGSTMHVKRWCGNMNSKAEWVCRRTALRYKDSYDPDMQVGQWCRDVQSVQEARCRAQNLRRRMRGERVASSIRRYCRGY